MIECDELEGSVSSVRCARRVVSDASWFGELDLGVSSVVRARGHVLFTRV